MVPRLQASFRRNESTRSNSSDQQSAISGIDCALPMIWARRERLAVSGFITYTDSETWAGVIHPMQALRQYRQERVPDAKAIVCEMTSNGFSVADSNDAGLLDLVGFDTATPAVIAHFLRGGEGLSLI